MSYTKTTWATGDVVTAEKLNNIEDGIAGNTTTVFECQFSGVENSATLTNAAALADALDAMEEDYTNFPHYNMILRLISDGETVDINYGFGEFVSTNNDGSPMVGFITRTGTIIGRKYQYQDSAYYKVYSADYRFSRSDIDANGTAALTYIGE